MKKLQFLLISLFISAAVSAAEQVIELPLPSVNRNGPTLMQALLDRHSTREFAEKPLELSDLSDLLWAANGVNRPGGMRTAPSALNKQDVDIYVVLPEGTYLYNAKEQQLRLVAEGDHRKAVAGSQQFVATAPVCLLLVSNVSLFGDADNERNKLMGAADVGIVSQNISLFCSFAGLATVPRASMDSEQLRTVLKLKEGQMLLMNHPVGYYK